jgi:hypothetical protein
VGDAAAVVSIFTVGVAVVGAQDDQPALCRGEGGDQAGEVGVGVGEGGLLGGGGVAAVAEVVAVGDVGGRDVDEQVDGATVVVFGDLQGVVDLVAGGVGFG